MNWLNWIIHPKETLKNWGVKRFVLSIVNKALNAYGESVTKARAIVATYIAKAEALLAFLKSLDAKLADNKIDDDEADAIVEEAQKLGKELVA